MNKKFENIFDVSKSRTYINLGFKDYIAARVLMNNGLLIQGATLASTSIEKYFKAILTLNKIAYKKHLDSELCNKLKNFDPDMYDTFNESFLYMLIKCYKLRYIDNALNEFSIVIAQFPLLAELDFSISKIEQKLNIFQDGKKLELGYRQMWNQKAPELIKNNFVFLGTSKGNFIETNESKVYCLRLDPNFGIQSSLLETYYTAAKQSYDGDFSREFVITDYPTIDKPHTGFELPFKAKAS